MSKRMSNFTVLVARLVVAAIVTAFAAQSSVAGTASVPATGEAPPGFEFVTPPRAVPDMAFLTADGETSLAAFRGKVVVLNFWATWCAPCVREMPSLDRLQVMLGGDDFAVVALSEDRGGMPLVVRFYDKYGLENLARYLDPMGRAAAALGVVGMPTTLVIDAEGREIGRIVGPAEWDSPAALALIGGLLDGEPKLDSAAVE
jgi:thiol-disulfide isomerase/thioredoxin